MEDCKTKAFEGGYPYYAIQDGNKCKASKKAPTNASITDSDCSRKCIGASDNTSKCGGNYKKI